MLSMEVDMVQYDCPYIDTTDDYDISFFTKQWDFNAARDILETRIMATGTTPKALDRGLDGLRDHQNMRNFELLHRKGEKALIRSQIGETKAMEAIRNNNGYITGPFEIRDGSEMWRVGFDSKRVSEDALSELDRHNDFTVESRETVDLEDYYDVLQNVDVAGGMLDRCRDLSTVERETLVTAVEEGYFTRPREADLSTLADEFDISKTAVSKNLRRSQRKVLGEVVEAIEAVEERSVGSRR
ncbi:MULTISPECIES: helix-turn-helix domain-containing protein [Salinibaculum]|uniref:helix-turn-helix domain-containing protein n=1 Tax=Salinibaculum TaxID=2732368 RepID=UPI0030CA9F70